MAKMDYLLIASDPPLPDLRGLPSASAGPGLALPSPPSRRVVASCHRCWGVADQRDGAQVVQADEVRALAKQL